VCTADRNITGCDVDVGGLVCLLGGGAIVSDAAIIGGRLHRLSIRRRRRLPAEIISGLDASLVKENKGWCFTMQVSALLQSAEWPENPTRCCSAQEQGMLNNSMKQVE
jgi:hypothetical protein